jgi:hypothetical protein
MPIADCRPTSERDQLAQQSCSHQITLLIYNTTMREHGSLTKDAETNQAAWEAAKGAGYGGLKVRDVVKLRWLTSCGVRRMMD